jgi:hypothetical protein
MIQTRLKEIRNPDSVEKYYEDYIYTENLSEVWGKKLSIKNLIAKPAKNVS